MPLEIVEPEFSDQSNLSLISFTAPHKPLSNEHFQAVKISEDFFFNAEG